MAGLTDLRVHHQKHHQKHRSDPKVPHHHIRKRHPPRPPRARAPPRQSRRCQMRRNRTQLRGSGRSATVFSIVKRTTLRLTDCLTASSTRRSRARKARTRAHSHNSVHRVHRAHTALEDASFRAGCPQPPPPLRRLLLPLLPYLQQQLQVLQQQRHTAARPPRHTVQCTAQCLVDRRRRTKWSWRRMLMLNTRSSCATSR